jgi:hypothetical protein
MPILFAGDESDNATAGLITLFCCAVVTAVSAAILLREVKALLQREDALTAALSPAADGAAQQPADTVSGTANAGGAGGESGGTPASAPAAATRAWTKDARASSTVGVTAVSIELGPTIVDPPTRASSSSSSSAAAAAAESGPAERGAGDGVFGTGGGLETASLLLAGSAASSREAEDDPQTLLV